MIWVDSRRIRHGMIWLRSEQWKVDSALEIQNLKAGAPERVVYASTFFLESSCHFQTWKLKVCTRKVSKDTTFSLFHGGLALILCPCTALPDPSHFQKLDLQAITDFFFNFEVDFFSNHVTISEKGNFIQRHYFSSTFEMNWWNYGYSKTSNWTVFGPKNTPFSSKQFSWGFIVMY